MTSASGGSAAPTPSEIARRAQELKVAHLAVMLALPAFFHPTTPLLSLLLTMNGQSPQDDLPVQLSNAPDDPDRLEYSAREVFSAATRLSGDAVGRDFMSMSMLLGGTRLGDMVLAGGYSRSSVALLQFTRHFRNACAHGDRWHFKNGEPRTAARCRGLTLRPELHGVRATWVTVGPRLYVEFLDDVTAYFSSL